MTLNRNMSYYPYGCYPPQYPPQCPPYPCPSPYPLCGPTGAQGATGAQGFTGAQGPEGVKSFIIDHPLKKDHYLIHACLEGPEAGVYYRGKAHINHPCTKGSLCFAKGSLCFAEVELPSYVDAFATNCTVHVTPIFDEENDNDGHYKVTEVQHGRFRIYGPPGRVNWIVYGSRGSIEVEPEKSKTNINGEGPYRWV